MLRQVTCKWTISVLLSASALVLPAQTAAEWDSARVNAVAQKLRCPCGCNLTMACQMPPHPCPTCKKNRIQIYKMLTAGKSDQEIVDAYVAEKGEGVIWVTPGRPVKMTPYAVLLLGFGGVVVIIRRYLRAETTLPAIDDAEFERLNKILRGSNDH